MEKDERIPVKINNFRRNPNKLIYTYLLTPKGISEKTKLTIAFMKRKMQEYEELKSDLKKKQMWAVIKFKKDNLALLQKDLTKKLGSEPKIYIPKIKQMF